jgi:hypothetical protein
VHEAAGGLNPRDIMNCASVGAGSARTERGWVDPRLQVSRPRRRVTQRVAARRWLCSCAALRTRECGPKTCPSRGRQRRGCLQTDRDWWAPGVGARIAIQFVKTQYKPLLIDVRYGPLPERT